MKKITQSFLLFTILFFATSFVNTANSQDCSHTFNMIDSYGDGWSGNTVSVFVNDNPALDPSGAVLSAQTLASGASGSFNFMASPNDIITLSWVEGSYSYEVSFEIIGCDGATVIASGDFGNTLEPVEPVEPAECGDTITYCYDNGVSEIFNASVDNVGDYITVSVVEGDTESGYDFLVIYDSSDNSGTELYREAGDHAGVLITSTTGVISVWVEADSSVSCLVPSSFSGLPDTSLVMNISCAPPPTCFAPTGLSATATSSTEATASWTAGDSETAWQYVVQPSGTGEPTGAGTATTTNPISLSGLMSNTAYEIWLRADCGGDLSSWVSTDFTTLCDVFTAPYSQDFENTGAIPNCWSMNGDEPWLFTNSAANSHIGNAGSIGNTTASGGYFAYVDDSSPDSIGTTLESPFIDASSLTTPVLSFYLLSNNEGNSNVSLSVDVYDGAAWNTGLYTSNSNTADWEEVIVNLSNLTITGSIQVRFVVDERPTGDYYDDVAIDDFKIMELPSCAKPTDLSISNITSISASLNWTAGDTETAWQYVIQASGTGEPTGSGLATTTNPLLLSGLTSNTDYEIYLRADCDGEFSEWVRTTFITTAGCGDSISITYENNFNGLIYSFSAPSGQYASVTVGGQTESCCDRMWITDGSGNALYGSQTSPIAGSLSGTYESTDGTILIYVDSDVSAVYEMTFVFTCADPPSCIAPTALSATATSATEATVSWTAGDSETAWQYVVQASGTGEPTGAGTATTTNPISLSGLMSNTAYEIYLRADCGGDLSPWVSTDFTTPPAPIIPDYTNDFSLFPGDLWSEAEGTLANGPSGTTSLWGTGNFAHGTDAPAAYINIYFTNRDEWLISPSFDLSGVNYYLNVDVAATEYYSSFSTGDPVDAIWGVDDFVTLMVSEDSGLTWTELYRWDANNNPGVAGAAMPEIDLSAYTGLAKFAFYAESTASNEDIDFFVDNFSVTSTSLGIQEVSTLQFKYFPNPVNDKLTINAQTNVDNIVVLNMLGQVVSSQRPNSLNCMVDMAELRTGVYFVQVSIGNSTQTVRVLKQ